MKKIALENLKKVVKGVKKNGCYIMLMSDNEVRKAVQLCYDASCTEAEVRFAIEQAYFEGWLE